MTFQESAARFDSYVDAFRRADGSLSDAMQCKYDHTFDVVRYAHIIAEGAEFPEEDLFLAGICALFPAAAALCGVSFPYLRRTTSKFCPPEYPARAAFSKDGKKNLSIFIF